MKKYQMTCTCGDVQTVDAASHEEAVQKFKDMMTQDAVNAHFAEKHAGQPVPTVDQVHANLEAQVVEAPDAPGAPPAPETPPAAPAA